MYYCENQPCTSSGGATAGPPVVKVSTRDESITAGNTVSVGVSATSSIGLTRLELWATENMVEDKGWVQLEYVTVSGGSAEHVFNPRPMVTTRYNAHAVDTANQWADDKNGAKTVKVNQAAPPNPSPSPTPSPSPVPSPAPRPSAAGQLVAGLVLTIAAMVVSL
jgi:hypothetical protein